MAGVGRIKGASVSEELQSNFEDYLEDQSSLVANEWPGIVGHYERKSDPDVNYNGLAWALGINYLYFDPERGYHWPLGIPRERTITAYLKVLAEHGYELIAQDDRFEEGWEKIAVYIDGTGEPRHFARQIGNGKWTSKLVDLIDVEHDNLECLQGDVFGSINCVLMRRKRGKRES
jgi:hypothetical protein